MTDHLRQMILEADMPANQQATMLAALAPITAIVKASREVCDSIAIETWNQKGWVWLKTPIAALKDTIAFYDKSYRKDEGCSLKMRQERYRQFLI